MGDGSEDSGKQTCRLCAEEHEVTIMLFSQQSKDMLLQEKLSKYLLIELVENDNLPRNICIQCCTKLNSLCSFVEDIRQAQTSLNRQVSEQNKKKEQHPTVDKTDKNDATSNVDDFTDAATLKVITEDNDKNLQIINEDPKNSLSPPKSFICEICKRGFVSDIALKGHVWTHNVKEIKFKETAVKLKKKRKPAKYVFYSCELCNRKFRTQRTYNDHMSMHSSKKKVYTCKVCGRAYRSWACLRSHNLTHSDDKPHPCHLCPKRFKRKLELQVHINQHIGRRPYKCPHCDQTFASASNCHSHRTRIHPSKTVLRRPGQGKQKDTEVEIEVENVEEQCMINDRGLYKYQCQHCTHSFTTRENFLCHMFQHTGKKMFPCSLCPAEYITEKGLTLHCQNLHPTNRNQSDVFFTSKNVLLT